MSAQGSYSTVPPCATRVERPAARASPLATWWPGIVVVGSADHVEQVVHIPAVLLQEGVRACHHRLGAQLAHAADGDHRAAPTSELAEGVYALRNLGQQVHDDHVRKQLAGASDK
jgi:hypothetical protein